MKNAATIRMLTPKTAVTQYMATHTLKELLMSKKKKPKRSMKTL